MLLEKKGVDFHEIPVDGDLQKRQEMIQLSGRTTVPQIWIGKYHVGGYDELRALENAGQLNGLLADH